jgi:integrase/recombinase XerD
MKKNPSLRQAVAYYLQSRRKLGFALAKDGVQLAGLVRYAEEIHHRGPLTTRLAMDWAKLPQDASPLWWARRLDTVRRFARFWVAYDASTQVPPTGVFGPSYHRGHVHIYTDKEIGALLEATQQLGPKRGWQPNLYRALLGLLACTGLRISEALALEDRDVDRESGLLTIRRGKGGHSRCLPLHASAITALERHRQLRQRTIAQPKGSAFFLSSVGRPLVYRRVAAVFRQLCNSLGWTHPPRPRLHDLRHTFAVRCLIEWHEKNEDVGQRILALSTYLGHRQVTDTYWYLTAVPQLLKIASKRFETGAKV